MQCVVGTWRGRGVHLKVGGDSRCTQSPAGFTPLHSRVRTDGWTRARQGLGQMRVDYIESYSHIVYTTFWGPQWGHEYTHRMCFERGGCLSRYILEFAST